MPRKHRTFNERYNRRPDGYDRTRRRTDPGLAESKRIRSTSQWQKLRLIYLMDNPLCEDPFGRHKKRARTVAATQVHHIQGIAQSPALAFDQANLMAVCFGCHAKLEANQSKPEGDGVGGVNL